MCKVARNFLGTEGRVVETSLAALIKLVVLPEKVWQHNAEV